MKTKKFVAATVNEALKKVKADFGKDALIISNRKVHRKGGAWGMFGKDVIEILAASADAQWEDGNYQLAKRSNKANVGSLDDMSSSSPISEVKDIISELNSRLDKGNDHYSQLQHMRQEITELKGTISSLLKEKPQFYDKDWHENLVSLYQKLVVNGLEEKFSHRIISEIIKNVAKDNYDDYEYLKLFTARIFMQSTAVQDLNEQMPEGGIVALIGTTGVGKTTTLAKLVASIKLRSTKQKIALLSLDSDKVGGHEKIKEYAKMIKVPCKTLTDMKKCVAVINQMQGYDWIFIDTPGVSQRDNNKLQELQESLASIEGLNSLLVLNSGVRDQELNEITVRFKNFKPCGVVFTKIDEAINYGSLINHLIRFKLPLYYLATGQQVPDDIEVASYERLIDLVLNMAELDTANLDLNTKKLEKTT